MELNHLRYFYEVAKLGSFTAAAKSLRVSQPSISKLVRQLEQREGYDFLERKKSGVNLTPMGRILFESCQRIFEEVGSLRQNLDSRKEECSGELWVGASDNLCNYVFPPAMHEFLERNPNVELKLFVGVSDLIERGLRDYQLEIGFFYTPVRGSELEAIKLGFVEFYLVTAPQKTKSAPTLLELQKKSFVGSLVSDYRGPFPALKMLKEIGLSPETTKEINHQETQKRFVMAGAGYTVLPKHMVTEEIERGKLIQIKTPRRIGSNLYLVKRKRRMLSKVAQRWIDALKHHTDTQSVFSSRI